MARSPLLLLLLVIALLIYGSVYPGIFRPTPATVGDAIFYLIHYWPTPLDARTAVDAALNVLVYIPLGWIAYLVFRNVVTPVLLAAALSFSIECVQYFLVGRHSNLLDVTSNTIGAILGVGISRFGRVSLPFSAWSRYTTPLILSGLWVSFHLFPLIPSLGYYRLQQKLSAFFVFDGVEMLAAMAEWMAAAMLVERIAGAANAPRWMLLLLVILPARLGILHQNLTASELTGAILSLLLWIFLLRRSAWRMQAVAGLFLLSLAASGLAPFHFARHPQPFSWMPFGVSFEVSSWERAGLTLLRKAYRYGVAIWLLEQCRIRAGAATAIVAVLLAAIEVIQIYLPGRFPEITDPLLAVLMAGSLRLLEGAHKQKMS